MSATAPAKKKPKKEAKAKEPKAEKVKVDKAKKPKPETVRVERWRVENWARCKQLNEEIDKLQIELAQKKTEAKELKETISSRMTTLRRLSNDAKERLPLFDGLEEKVPVAVTPPANGTTPSAPIAPAAKESDWQNVLLLESLIKSGTLTKPADALLARGVAALVKSKVDTVGKLEALRSTGKGGRKWWDAIKGLSEDAADKVTDAVVAWLQKNRDASTFAAAAPKKPSNTPELAKAKADETVPVHAKKTKKPVKKRKAK